MRSRVGTLHLNKGTNTLRISGLKTDARIDHIYLGLYPPFVDEPRLRLPAKSYKHKYDGSDGRVCGVDGLGYTDGVLVLPFDTPSYEQIENAPFVDYELDIQPTDSTIEIRTLPTLHVYEGRDARYAVRIGDAAPHVFSIHAADFSAEWRWNVLRGYASRSIVIPDGVRGLQRCRIYLLDPGIVLQEVLCHGKQSKKTN